MIPGGVEESSSLLELYISFALDTRTMAPVYFRSLKFSTASRRSAFLLREDHQSKAFTKQQRTSNGPRADPMATGRYPIANATAALEFLNAHLTTGASREQSIQADAASCDLNTQLRTFVQFFKWPNSHWHVSNLDCGRGRLRSSVTCRLRPMCVANSFYQTVLVLARHFGTISIVVVDLHTI